jgi:hypothetical protein
MYGKCSVIDSHVASCDKTRPHLSTSLPAMSATREWLCDCEKCMQGGRDTPKSVSRSTYFSHRKTPCQTPAGHSARAEHTQTAPASTREVQPTQSVAQASTIRAQHVENEDDFGHENLVGQRDGALSGSVADRGGDGEMQAGWDEQIIDQETAAAEEDHRMQDDFYDHVCMDQRDNNNRFENHFSIRKTITLRRMVPTMPTILPQMIS